MGNKTKPSILRLVANKSDFESEGTLFKPEMLNWPFFDLDAKDYREENPLKDNLYGLTIYRRALEALTNINPFETKIVLNVNSELERLYLARNTWAKIYLKGQYVLAFSNYTTDNMAPLRKQNDPFRSLLDWPEIDPDSEEYLLVYAETCFDKINIILSEWSVEKWTSFYKERLVAKANALTTKAKAKMDDAKVLQVKAFDLMHAFFPSNF